MTKTKLAACLLATVFAGGTALAQTSPASPPATTAAPAATAPAQPSTMGAGSVQFLTNESAANQMWRASKLMGVNIYGPDDEKVGDINEVLVDHQGNAKAVVIGVGGFLGIGEKDVAIPFNAIQWMATSRSAAATTAVPVNRPANAPAGTVAGTAPAANAPAGTVAGTAPAANAPMAGTAPRASTETTGTTVARTADMDRGYPDHGVISLTKDQIKAAPSYRLAR